MNWFIERIKAEPAVFAEIIRTGLFLLVVFGVAISDEQQAAIIVFLSALITFFTRQAVTPNTKVDTVVTVERTSNTSLRSIVFALLLGGLAFGTMPACATKVTPTQQEQIVSLQKMAKLADAASTVVKLVDAVQVSEIAVYNSKSVESLTKEKHDRYQAAFVKFADVAEPQLKIAKDATLNAQTRLNSVIAIDAALRELLAVFDQEDNPTLTITLASLRAAAIVLSMEV